ncbi:hypothetical protein C8R44DRAFT_877339 [Mycena epipterygia]|nr:hypothetical protein C8R44DRAFT_877339 [Mycena epipterygia]
MLARNRTHVVPGTDAFAALVASPQMRIWSAVQILKPSLDHPEDSPICAASIVKAAAILIPAAYDKELKIGVRLLRTEHQDFLDTLMHFVAVHRTEEQLESLEVRLNQCRCDLGLVVLRGMHDNGYVVPAGSFSIAVSSIFAILGSVVANGLKVGHVQSTDLNPADASKAKKWPSTAATMFPAGQEAAIQSFTRFYRLTRAPSILGLLKAMLPHYPSLAMAAAKDTRPTPDPISPSKRL